MATSPESASPSVQQGPGGVEHLAVSEFLGEHQGASSPFGDLDFPLSAEELEQLAGGHVGDRND